MRGAGDGRADRLERRLLKPPRPVRLRLGVVHADAEDTALRVKRDLERRYHPLEILMGPVATAIAVLAPPPETFRKALALFQ